MEKWLCWGSMGVSGLLLILFVIDVVMGIPFGGHWRVADILAAVASAMVLYMSWNALKDWR